MKTIKFNYSNVDPVVHAEIMRHMLKLGYTVVEDVTAGGDGVIQEEPLTIPQLYPFEVMEGSTITSIKDDVPMSDYCMKNLTDDNFPSELPKGLVTGGFLSMGKNFKFQEGVDTIEKLARQTDRNFRVGTAFELVLFWKKNHVICPRYFVTFGTVWNGMILSWGDAFTEFHFSTRDGVYAEYFGVFLVEDL